MLQTKYMKGFWKNIFSKATNVREVQKGKELKQFSADVRKQFVQLKQKGLSIPIFTL